MEKDVILEMRNITKSFPGVKALKGVDLTLKKGTVHALMGENGAGKSTLMKILYGIYQADSGTITYNGQELYPKSPIEAIQHGIAMIPQEISPVPNLTVAGNVFLGREPVKNYGGIKIVDQKRIIQETEKLFQKLDITIDPSAMMGEISIANAQLVAIITAVSQNADLIIMDEPTSALTDKEVEQLYRIVDDLVEQGITMVFITHKLEEVFRMAHEVTVFRDGEFIGTEPIEHVDKDTLITMMVGRDMDEFFHKEFAEIGEVLLSVKDLTLGKKFHHVSFDLRRGEVLGVAGLMGAGRTEVMEALFGFKPAESGEIRIKGENVNVQSPKDAIEHNIGFVTEDRKLTGLFLDLDISNNMIMPDVDTYLRAQLLDSTLIKQRCREQKDQLKIKTPSLTELIKNLSGGNQQKVLISRWLLTDPDILILDEPTRGIDVGAKSEIHRLICELAKAGKGIIMISSEMPEILSMSDRIIVMHEGGYSGELSREEATQEKVLQLATGQAVH